MYSEWPGPAKDDLYGPGDLAITIDFRDVLGEIVQKRLLDPNLADMFPGYSIFKFRCLAQGSGAPMPTSTPLVIELPFGIKIPLPKGK